MAETENRNTIKRKNVISLYSSFGLPLCGIMLRSLSVWANNGCRRYHQHHGVNIVYEDRSRIDERQGVKFCNIFERMLCEN